MRTLYRHTFTVSGKGQFPFGLVSSEEATPVSRDDAITMGAAKTAWNMGIVKVTLQVRHNPQDWTPCVKEWEKAGWDVCTTEAPVPEAPPTWKLYSLIIKGGMDEDNCSRIQGTLNTPYTALVDVMPYGKVLIVAACIEGAMISLLRTLRAQGISCTVTTLDGHHANPSFTF